MIHLDTNFLIMSLALTQEQLDMARIFLPRIEAFLPEDASRAATLFNDAGRRRGSLTDCMIAAVSLRMGAELATSNTTDFNPFERSGLRVISI